MADMEFARLSGIYKECVGAFVAPRQSFALMDFPSHSNIGDSAIWVGELAFFDDHVGVPPCFVNTCLDDPAEVAAFLPDGPIFLHGGGNFGDIWKNHEDFRLRALEVLKGRPLVQLPQSIHFDDPANRDRIARAISDHGQFSLLVRDQNSFDLAQKYFDCEVMMCPDAAVNLRHLPSENPTKPILSFLREDKESVWKEAHAFLKTLGDVQDWPNTEVWTLPDRLKLKLFAPFPKVAMAHREDMYRRHAQARVQAGIDCLQPGKFIVTDRLHVHLISSLMRRPHVVLDNKYGKIARHIAAWSDFGLARPVSSFEDLQTFLNN